jgi:hypothetical protein
MGVRDIRIPPFNPRNPEVFRMSPSFRAGLIVLGLLSAVDLTGPLFTDGEHPPMAIAIAGAVIGLASLVMIVFAARGSRRAAITLVVLRALSALSAVPAFYEPGVPPEARVLVGAAIVLTVVGIGLVLTPSRRVSKADVR